MNPLDIFLDWYANEVNLSQLEIPSACCLSTVGLDGFPNARFVSLKEVQEGRFVVTGPGDSRKGQEWAVNPMVALTFWWTASQRQVRVQGKALPISEERASRLFSERSRDAQIVSQAFDQGNPLPEGLAAEDIFAREKLNWAGQDVSRPEAWGGIAIAPRRIEFMEFKPSRLHDRLLFQIENGHWLQSHLQP